MADNPTDNGSDDGIAYAVFFGVVFGGPAAVLVLWSLLNIISVQQKTVVIVERWGKFYKKLDGGIHWLVPMMDTIRTVVWRSTEAFVNGDRQEIIITQTKIKRLDLRQSILDFPLQPIITRDNVEIFVHPMLIYELVDPVRVAYETYDLSHAVEKLVQTTLRSVIGDMGLDDTLASREEINRSINQKINQVCRNWGMQICRVELLEIIPTPSVQSAMHQQLAAERIRRATIVTAEGYREQAKTEAEGECQSQISIATGEQQVSILRAKGLSDGRILVAKAEAEAIQIIGDALKEFGVNVTQYMIGLRYIETFTSIATAAKKRDIYFPMETDVMGAFS